MTDDQILDYLAEHFTQVRKTQGATAATVRSLVSALREADHTRQSENDRLALVERALNRFEETHARVEIALVQLIGHVQPRDLGKLSAEDLINNVPIDTIRRARDIHWARSKGEPDPLPPPPTANAPHLIEQETSSGHVEIVPVHYHRRKDDSVTFSRGKDGDIRMKGDIKLKTLFSWMKSWLGWVAAGGTAIYEAVQAIRHALGH